jgi:hypothetical protein
MDGIEAGDMGDNLKVVGFVGDDRSNSGTWAGGLTPCEVVKEIKIGASGSAAS